MKYFSPFCLLLCCLLVFAFPGSSVAKRIPTCPAKDNCEAQCKDLAKGPRFGGAGKVRDADCLDEQNRCCEWNDPRWNICGCVIEVDAKCLNTINGERVDCKTKVKELPRGGCYCSAGSTTHIPLSLGLLVLFILRLRHRERQEQ